MKIVREHPAFLALSTSMVSLAAGATAFVGANFGMPLWVSLPLILWLVTVGLPTTLGVVLVASVWGEVPGLSGLWFFVGCAALVSASLQTLFFLALARFGRRKAGRGK
ncbi:MAG: hypothetical protein ACYDH9_09180 [Limisphaerales bacterium]